MSRELIIISEPFELRALVATMKAAKAQGVNMAIWDRDIKAVENAIVLIHAIRASTPDHSGSGLADSEGDDAEVWIWKLTHVLTGS